jgi:hypothetical protein
MKTNIHFIEPKHVPHFNRPQICCAQKFHYHSFRYSDEGVHIFFILRPCSILEVVRKVFQMKLATEMAVSPLSRAEKSFQCDQWFGNDLKRSSLFSICPFIRWLWHKMYTACSWLMPIGWKIYCTGGAHGEKEILVWAVEITFLWKIGEHWCRYRTRHCDHF